MSYIYKLCFVCSTQIKGFFELNPSDPRQRTSAGTLCEILAIPLRDTTFTFGAKFQQVPFCPKCAIQMREFDKILKDLKELEEKIEKGKIEVEERLRASCLKRRSEGHEGAADDGPFPLHPIDYFREAVVSELKYGKLGSPPSGNRTMSTPRSGSAVKRESKGRRPGPASKTIKLRSTLKPEANAQQGGDENSNQTGDPVANALQSILSDIDDVQGSVIESCANEGDDGVEMNKGPPDSDPDYVEEEEEIEMHVLNQTGEGDGEVGGTSKAGGKAIAFKHSATRFRNTEEIEKILKNAGEGLLGHMVSQDSPVRPKAGEMFLFLSKGNRDYTCDQYFGLKSTGNNFSRGGRILKRYYRLQTDGRWQDFFRDEYQLRADMSKDVIPVVTHYTGDHNLWSPRAHGNSKKNAKNLTTF